MMRMLRSGFSLVELMVVLALITLLTGILLPALSRARAEARSMVDATQLRSIHQAWNIHAADAKGVYPVPGLMKRGAVFTGAGWELVQGRGNEAIYENEHQNLYSACIMLNYFTPELCVGPTEPNAHVWVMHEYDWNRYDPLSNVYWDDRFQADLNRDSNQSYAQMPLFGKRRAVEWRGSGNSDFAVVGNRGAKHGSYDPETYLQSATLAIHGGHKQWVGNVVYNDNHVEVEDSFTPAGMNFQREGTMHADNLFRNDTGPNVVAPDGWDVWLAIVSQLQGGCMVPGPFLHSNWD